MILIKSKEIFRVLMSKTYPQDLIDIALEVLDGIAILEEALPTITSAYREDDPGVHGYCRGLDFRSWHIKGFELDRICSQINKKWQYDPERPEMVCLMHHDIGRGPHLHLQVHPNTVLNS